MLGVVPGVASGYILLADLPISVVTFALGWQYPFLANLWILIVWTLWWYLLSIAIEWVLNRLKEPKGVIHLTTRREKAEGLKTWQS
jgi:hypothetical protein